MPYNSAAKNFQKRLCSWLSSREVHFRWKNGPFLFWSPLWGLRGRGLRGNVCSSS